MRTRVVKDKDAQIHIQQTVKKAKNNKDASCILKVTSYNKGIGQTKEIRHRFTHTYYVQDKRYVSDHSTILTFDNNQLVRTPPLAQLPPTIATNLVPPTPIAVVPPTPIAAAVPLGLKTILNQILKK